VSRLSRSDKMKVAWQFTARNSLGNGVPLRKQRAPEQIEPSLRDGPSSNALQAINCLAIFF
jgi:hypothetical protein